MLRGLVMAFITISLMELLGGDVEVLLNEDAGGEQKEDVVSSPVGKRMAEIKNRFTTHRHQ